MKSMFGGLLKLARRTNTTLAGGDLSHTLHETHIEVMVCGAVPERSSTATRWRTTR